VTARTSSYLLIANIADNENNILALEAAWTSWTSGSSAAENV
jgi:hypothetical protein